MGGSGLAWGSLVKPGGGFGAILWVVVVEELGGGRWSCSFGRG